MRLFAIDETQRSLVSVFRWIVCFSVMHNERTETSEKMCYTVHHC